MCNVFCFFREALVHVIQSALANIFDCGSVSMLTVTAVEQRWFNWEAHHCACISQQTCFFYSGFVKLCRSKIQALSSTVQVPGAIIHRTQSPYYKHFHFYFKSNCEKLTEYLYTPRKQYIVTLLTSPALHINFDWRFWSWLLDAHSFSHTRTQTIMKIISFTFKYEKTVCWWNTR